MHHGHQGSILEMEVSILLFCERNEAALYLELTSSVLVVECGAGVRYS